MGYGGVGNAYIIAVLFHNTCRYEVIWFERDEPFQGRGHFNPEIHADGTQTIRPEGRFEVLPFGHGV